MANYQPKTKLYIPRSDTNGAVIDIWAGTNGTDRSGNGNNSTITGPVSEVNDGRDIWYETHGQGNGLITVASDATWHSKDYNVYTFQIKIKGNGEGGSGRILEKHTGGSAAFSMFMSGGRIYMTQSYSIAPSQYWIDGLIGNTFILQIWQHRVDATVDPRFFVNGVEVTPTKVLTGSGVVSTDATANFVFGNRPGLDREGNWKISQFKFTPVNLTDDQLRAEYLKYALGHLVRHTPKTEYTATLATVTAPGYVGPWSLLSGTANWVDDGTDRYIERATDCDFIKSSNQAYGAFYFKMKHSTADNIFEFIANKRIAWDGVGQTGYNVTFSVSDDKAYLYRQAAGVSTQFGVSSAVLVPGTTYECLTTRRVTDGRFDVWLKGGAITTWTNLFNGTDNTYTTSKFMCGELTANGVLINPLSWPYGDSLTPNDIKEIAD